MQTVASPVCLYQEPDHIRILRQARTGARARLPGAPRVPPLCSSQSPRCLLRPLPVSHVSRICPAHPPMSHLLRLRTPAASSAPTHPPAHIWPHTRAFRVAHTRAVRVAHTRAFRVAHTRAFRVAHTRAVRVAHCPGTAGPSSLPLPTIPSSCPHPHSSFSRLSSLKRGVLSHASLSQPASPPRLLPAAAMTVRPSRGSRQPFPRGRADRRGRPCTYLHARVIQVSHCPVGLGCPPLERASRGPLRAPPPPAAAYALCPLPYALAGGVTQPASPRPPA